MSEVSIGAIRLPTRSRRAFGQDIARKAMFRILDNLAVGSLTLHEGQSSHHFGGQGAADDIHAEVHVHDQAAYGQLLVGVPSPRGKPTCAAAGRRLT